MARKRNSTPDETLTANREFVELVGNVMSLRQELFAQLLDLGDRNINASCGYPDNITTEQYQAMYDREGIATRVVGVLPEESWAEDPTVTETEEPEKTEFEEAVDALVRDHNLWHYLQRVDEQSGIGEYGVLLLGIDDGKLLSEPVEGINDRGEKVGNPDHELMYLRVFPQSLASIAAVETDETNPRYGEPTAYRIKFANEHGEAANEKEVHWSRCIHIADMRTSSEVFGTPRMQVNYNRLYDLRKILGGSGEMFWKGGFPGLSIETHPGDEDVDIDVDALKEQVLAYQHGMQRYLSLLGLTAKSLEPQVASPAEHVRTHLLAIAIAMGVPLRILMGTEEAKLAGQTDTSHFNRRLGRRQNKYISPMVIRPTFDRFITLGILPEPAELFEIVWADLNSPSDLDKATVAKLITESLAKYAGADVENLIPPLEFFVNVLGWSTEQGEAVIKAVVDMFGELPHEHEEEEVFEDDEFEEDDDAGQG